MYFKHKLLDYFVSFFNFVYEFVRTVQVYVLKVLLTHLETEVYWKQKHGANRVGSNNVGTCVSFDYGRTRCVNQVGVTTKLVRHAAAAHSRKKRVGDYPACQSRCR